MPHPVGYLLRGIKGHVPAKARTGLYAGRTIDVANRVSRDYEVRSRKLRKPNVVKRRLFSQALGRKVQLHVTTTALKAIDRAGGLDRYLLRTPDSLLFSDKGSDLKFQIGLIHRHQQWLAAQQQRQQRQGQQALPDAEAVAAAVKQVAAGSSQHSLLPPAAAAALRQRPPPPVTQRRQQQR